MVNHRMILLLCSVLLLMGHVLEASASESGNFCVQDYKPGAGCSANDVRIETMNVVTLIESCGEGTPGEFEAVFEFLISASGSPNRYDIGLYLALDGGSALTGDSCFHDYLDITSTNPTYTDLDSDGFDESIIDPPWLDMDSDGCGDLATNTQVFKVVGPLRISCADSNGDGIVDIEVCTSWDHNGNTPCNGVTDAFPGTNSKCSCQSIELGFPLAVELLEFSARQSRRGIELTWLTGSETETLGFNILKLPYEAVNREIVPPAKQINKSLISAQGTAISGHEYTFWDHSDLHDTGYRYFLQVINLSGNASILAHTDAVGQRKL